MSSCETWNHNMPYNLGILGSPPRQDTPRQTSPFYLRISSFSIIIAFGSSTPPPSLRYRGRSSTFFSLPSSSPILSSWKEDGMLMCTLVGVILWIAYNQSQSHVLHRSFNVVILYVKAERQMGKQKKKKRKNKRKH